MSQVPCYPDIHPEAADKVDDIENLKKRLMPVQSFFYQLFFDNDTFFNFAEDCRLAGINVPVIPGIMPCINAASIKNGHNVGAKFPEKFPEDCAQIRRQQGGTFTMPECLTARVR